MKQQIEYLRTEASVLIGCLDEVIIKAKILKQRTEDGLDDISTHNCMKQMRADINRYSRRLDEIHEELDGHFQNIQGLGNPADL